MKTTTDQLEKFVMQRKKDSNNCQENWFQKDVVKAKPDAKRPKRFFEDGLKDIYLKALTKACLKWQKCNGQINSCHEKEPKSTLLVWKYLNLWSQQLLENVMQIMEEAEDYRRNSWDVMMPQWFPQHKVEHHEIATYGTTSAVTWWNKCLALQNTWRREKCWRKINRLFSHIIAVHESHNNKKVLHHEFYVLS
jgi:hypothetical protein